MSEQRGENVVERRYSLFSLAALGTSVLLHGVAYASLAAVPKQAAGSEMTSEVSFEVAPAPPPPEPARTAETPAPAREPAPRAPSPAAPRTEPAARERSPDNAKAAVDLSGVTLTNDSGEAGWSSVTGNGKAMLGPLGPVIAPRVAAAVASVRQTLSPQQAPALVAAADLSERPRPPALDGVLRQNYPEEARTRGISGTASVRARIGADGRVRQTGVLFESFSGFGDACRRTLLGSRWTPPKNREGSAVATEIAYTCRFVVER